MSKTVFEKRIEKLLASEYSNREARRHATPEDIASVAWIDGFLNGASRERDFHRPQYQGCPARRERRRHDDGWSLW